MFVIRTAQLHALAISPREAFITRTLERLAALMPGDPRLDDVAGARAIVSDAMNRAAGYRIEHARELSLFVFLAFEYGPGFESQPDKLWIGTTLRDATLDQGPKMDLIYGRLMAARGESA